ncbi:MAG: tetratricopeptide repeat protein [Chloroflexi bacterium]|nr:tetratricopeptide repeat protein [Chloroflexota bacterium]
MLLLVSLGWLGAALVGDAAYLANEEAGDRFAAGDHRGALARYRALQRERPELVELGVNAGNASYRLGDFARALADHSAALRVSDPGLKAIASYDRGNTLFRQARYEDARVAWVDSLRIDPTARDAKYNIELVDALLDDLAEQRAAGSQPGPQSPPGPNPGQVPGQVPGQRPQPGQAGQPGPPGPPQPGQVPGGDPGQIPRAPDRTEPPQPPPPSVGQAIGQFRRNLTVDEAFRVLEALRGEQRGIQGLIEGAPRRQGSAGQGGPLY